MILIIKLILKLHKDNSSKYKMQFLNNDFTYEGKKAVQTWLALRENNNCLLNLITGCATLCSNNWNQAFVITGNESFTSLWRNFGPLFFAELF